METNIKQIKTTPTTICNDKNTFLEDGFKQKQLAVTESIEEN